MHDDPFGPLKDAESFYDAEQYELLFEQLAQNVEQANSRFVLYGESGTGKTLLLERHCAGIDERVCFAAIDDSCTDGTHFLQSMLEQFGFEEVSGTLDQLRNITRELLIHQGKKGEPVLLLVDNVHRLPPNVLEELRWTATIEHRDTAVANLVLAGLPALHNIVASPAMKESLARNHVRFNLRAFTEEETTGYINHRLDAVAHSESVRFEQDAYPLIYRYSGGIPGTINLLCASVLDISFEEGERALTAETVRQAAEALQLMPHALPLQGKCRRKTDPGYKPPGEEPDGEETADTDGSEAAAAAPDPALEREVAALSAQVEQLRSEAASDRTTIERQSARIAELDAQLAEKTRAYEDMAARLESGSDQASSLQAEIGRLTDDLAEKEKSAQQLTADLAERRATIDNLEAALSEKVRACEQMTSELASGSSEAASLQTEITRLTDELAEREDAARKLDEELTERHIAMEKLEAELGDKSRALEDMASELEDRSQTVSSLEAEIGKLTAEIAERDEAAQELSADLTERHATIGKLEAELDQANEKIARIEQEEITALTTQIEWLEADAVTAQATIDEQSTRIAELENRLKDKARAFDDAANELESGASEASHLQAEIDRLTQELTERDRAAQQLTADLNERHDLISRLEAELNDANNEIVRIEELEGTCGRLQLELLERDEAAGSMQAELATLRQKQAQLLDQLTTATGRISEIGPLKSVISGLQNEADSIAEELTTARRERSLREKHAEKLEVKLQEAETSRKTLEERVERVAQLEAELAERDAVIERLRRALSNQDKALRDAQQVQARSGKPPPSDVTEVQDEPPAASAAELKRRVKREPIRESDGHVMMTIVYGGRVESTVVQAVKELRWMIGRAEGNDVPLRDSAVSRHHALLLCRDGCLAIDDLNSTNGLAINSRRIDSANLCFGDVVTIGDYQLRFSAYDEDTDSRESGGDSPDGEADATGENVVQGAAAAPQAGTEPGHEDDGHHVDDLKQIAGIGAKTEDALNDLGVYRFAQLARMRQEELEALAARIGASPSRPNRERWVEQAQELTSGY